MIPRSVSSVPDVFLTTTANRKCSVSPGTFIDPVFQVPSHNVFPLWDKESYLVATHDTLICVLADEVLLYTYRSKPDTVGFSV